MTPVVSSTAPRAFDSRVQINVANAVNIKRTISCAESVRVIVLVNFSSLKADRGRGLKELIKILRDLFGDAERLTRHAGSILLGVSQAPFNDATKRNPVPMEVGTLHCGIVGRPSQFEY